MSNLAVIPCIILLLFLSGGLASPGSWPYEVSALYFQYCQECDVLDKPNIAPGCKSATGGKRCNLNEFLSYIQEQPVGGVKPKNYWTGPIGLNEDSPTIGDLVKAIKKTKYDVVKYDETRLMPGTFKLNGNPNEKHLKMYRALQDGINQVRRIKFETGKPSDKYKELNRIREALGKAKFNRRLENINVKINTFNEYAASQNWGFQAVLKPDPEDGNKMIDAEATVEQAKKALSKDKRTCQKVVTMIRQYEGYFDNQAKGDKKEKIKSHLDIIHEITSILTSSGDPLKKKEEPKCDVHGWTVVKGRKG